MKNILLLTDFSKASKNALHFSFNFFEFETCVFHLLHISDFSTFIEDDIAKSLGNSGEKLVMTKLENWAKEEIQKLNTDNFSFEYHTKYDHFNKVINSFIADKNIDLIVMGSNGVTGASEVIFGSNTIKVLRNIRCTTLVVPENYSYKNSKEILIPLDKEDAIASDSFIRAKLFFNKFSVKFHLLRINSEENTALLQDDIQHISELMNFKNYTYSKVTGVPLHYTVKTYIQIHAIDMIVLINQEERFFSRLFYGSDTTKISNTNLLPLLVFHE